MTAAFAVALARKLPVKEMLRYAVAVSASNALTMKTGNFRQEDMEEILPKVTIEEVEIFHK